MTTVCVFHHKILDILALSAKNDESRSNHELLRCHFETRAIANITSLGSWNDAWSNITEGYFFVYTSAADFIIIISFCFKFLFILACVMHWLFDFVVVNVLCFFFFSFSKNHYCHSHPPKQKTTNKQAKNNPKTLNVEYKRQNYGSVRSIHLWILFSFYCI